MQKDVSEVLSSVARAIQRTFIVNGVEESLIQETLSGVLQDLLLKDLYVFWFSSGTKPNVQELLTRIKEYEILWVSLCERMIQDSECPVLLDPGYFAITQKNILDKIKLGKDKENGLQDDGTGTSL